MFKAILSVLTARWFVTLIGAIILALVVWFVGPLIAVGDVRPLDSEIVRLIVVLVILVVWGIWNIVSLLRAKKSNDQLVKGISQASAADAEAVDLEAAKKEEVGVLQERLEDAHGAAQARQARQGLEPPVSLPAALVHPDRAAGLRARRRRSSTPASTFPSPTSSARTPCAASAARATATGGSPTKRS